MHAERYGRRIRNTIRRFFGEDIFDMLNAILRPDLIAPDDIAEIPEVQSAENFRKDGEAVPEADYLWAYDYGKETFERSVKVYKELDDKANEIVKYLGGGTGLFTLAMLLRAADVGIIYWSIPSFLFSVLSIFFAILARQPNLAFYPPSVRSAIKYADFYKKESAAKAEFVRQWHDVVTSMNAAIAIKSERVRHSTALFFGAIVLLVLPLIYTIWSQP